jgi:hypothetical protein
MPKFVASFMFNSSKIYLLTHPHLWLFRITVIIILYYKNQARNN